MAFGTLQGGCNCCSGGIITTCCSGGLPNVLYGTITGTGCVDGTYEMMFDPGYTAGCDGIPGGGPGAWVGTSNGPGAGGIAGAPVVLAACCGSFGDGNGNHAAWNVQDTSETVSPTHCAGGSSLFASCSGTCRPFSMSALVIQCITQPACNFSGLVTITE